MFLIKKNKFWLSQYNIQIKAQVPKKQHDKLSIFWLSQTIYIFDLWLKNIWNVGAWSSFQWVSCLYDYHLTDYKDDYKGGDAQDDTINDIGNI